MSYIYIAGRGRSGSTILDIILGNSSEIESVGEMIAGLSRVDREVCSCGAAVLECPFWLQVRQGLMSVGLDLTDVGGMLRPGIAGIWRNWRGRADGSTMKRVRFTRAILAAIEASVGKRHLLDSGKAPGHALLLLQHLPDARIIHLVRDPRNVLRSHLDKIQRGRHSAIMDRYGIVGRSPWLFLLWQAASWTFSNLTCEAMARAYSRRVVRVRFEDLCANPSNELGRLGRELGMDLTEPIRKIVGGEELEVGHNVGGNQIRQGRVRFSPDSLGSRPSLPMSIKIATMLLCGPLMLWYGYLPNLGRSHRRRGPESSFGAPRSSPSVRRS